MTEKMESSVKLGVRPKISWMRSNSSGSTPNLRAVSVVGRVSMCSKMMVVRIVLRQSGHQAQRFVRHKGKLSVKDKKAAGCFLRA